MRDLQEVLEEMIKNDKTKLSSKQKELDIDHVTNMMQELSKTLATDLSPCSTHTIASSAVSAMIFQHNVMLQKGRATMDYIMTQLLEDEYDHLVIGWAQKNGVGYRAAALTILDEMQKGYAGTMVERQILVDSLIKLRTVSCDYEAPDREMVIAEIKKTAQKAAEELKKLARNGENIE